MPLFCHKKANVQSRNCCFPKIPLSSRQICCCASIQHESWVTHKHTQAPTLLVCAFNAVCRLCCMSWPSCAMSSQLAWHSLPGCRINTQLECPTIYFRPLHVSHRSFHAPICLFMSFLVFFFIWRQVSLPMMIAFISGAFSLCVRWQCGWRYQE